MRRLFVCLIPLVVASQACRGVVSESPSSQISSTTETSTFATAFSPLQLWNFQGANRKLSVCFLSQNHPIAERNLRTLVEREFNARTPVQFVNWGACYQDPRAELQISWIDPGSTSQPRSCMGSDECRAGRGMALIADFQHLSPFMKNVLFGCDANAENAQRCFNRTALHEFGHVLGLVHENSRPERAAECAYFDNTNLDQGRPYKAVLGVYDPLSMMNQCNGIRRTLEQGTVVSLSSGDIHTLSLLYGSKESRSVTNCDMIGEKSRGGYRYNPEWQACLIVWQAQTCPRGTFPNEHTQRCELLDPR